MKYPYRLFGKSYLRWYRGGNQTGFDSNCLFCSVLFCFVVLWPGFAIASCGKSNGFFSKILMQALPFNDEAVSCPSKGDEIVV